MTFPHGRRGAQDTFSQEEPKEILCVSYSGAIGRVLCGRVTQKPDSAQDAHHCKSVSPKYVKKNPLRSALYARRFREFADHPATFSYQRRLSPHRGCAPRGSRARLGKRVLPRLPEGVGTGS